ncbi:FecCD family ABC transporter permease [Ferrimonas aestuarii]|uniref:Iron ABC transporter permease n=1 Tax=Ferrimonas aestuarii TaxID=2569539 RepID=A0A4U1BTT6_9GAMM|nr:iron ABC transporter permease [Ferrimonas aestuarii]TKB56063.1 iron ABC transporter permease [Ferrimonas aestuarii]
MWRLGSVTVALLLLLVALMTLSVAWGPLSLSMEALWQGLRRTGEQPLAQTIIYDMRLPRVLLALLVGAALAVAGVLSQTLVRNPLADPYLLGVANGASLLAVTGITLGLALPQWLLAIVGAVVAFLLVMVSAHQRGLRLAPMALVLCGVTISAMGAALTTLMMLLGDERALSQILRWLMGSLVGAQWWDLLPLVIALTVLLPFLFCYSHQWDRLLLGEDKAQSLGLNLVAVRWQLAVAILLLTALSVAAAGVVGFLGLLVPHLCRLAIGGSHRLLLPLAALVGGTLCVAVDLLCRWLLAPTELPLSVPLALLTAPLLLSLIRRQAHG